MHAHSHARTLKREKNPQVTRIADAQALWVELQARDRGGFRGDDEEFEDEAGNVYSRKVFLDLQRQGLL